MKSRDQKEFDTPPSFDQTQATDKHLSPTFHREASFIKVSTRNEDNEPTKKTSIITPFNDQLSVVTSDMVNSKPKQRWFELVDVLFSMLNLTFLFPSRLTPKQQNMLKLTSLLLVLIVVSAAVIPAVYFLVLRQPDEQCKR